MKTDVVFWIINIVTKSGNAPFQHFQLNVDNSEAKFPLVYESAKSRFKSHLPEPTVSVTNVVTQNHIWPLTPFNVEVTFMFMDWRAKGNQQKQH